MNTNLLLLHGALGSRRQLDELAGLVGTTWNIESHNLPGHGGRPLPQKYMIDHFVEDTAEFIRNKSGGQTSIFGFSMGGYVALELARKYPELVGKVATLGTKFDWTPESADRESLLLDTDKMIEKVPAFTELLRHRHAPQDWKKVVFKTKDLLMRLGNGEARIMSSFALLHPVRIFRGGLDQMVGRDESVYIADRLENGRYVEIPGLRHPIEQADSETLARYLRDFLLDMDNA